ncbi:MAG: TIGR01459 family HAD-type hydrolase, partial [Hyphomicrobiaceae bacterium]
MASIEIIEHAGKLLSRYDVIVSDVWGVVHDGARAYADACEAFARFRARGGTVLLLSNAPMPSAWVANVLDEKRVPRESWDAIVSSGDIALAHIAEQGFVRVHHIGTDRDLPLFETMQAERVPVEAAQAIVCTGLIDDRNETGESYRGFLQAALARRLPLVCANPDLLVDVGGELLPCAGVVAELYESMGGPVYWAGKPHAPAYEMAMRAIAGL